MNPLSSLWHFFQHEPLSSKLFLLVFVAIPLSWFARGAWDEYQDRKAASWQAWPARVQSVTWERRRRGKSGYYFRTELTYLFEKDGIQSGTLTRSFDDEFEAESWKQRWIDRQIEIRVDTESGKHRLIGEARTDVPEMPDTAVHAEDSLHGTSLLLAVVLVVLLAISVSVQILSWTGGEFSFAELFGMQLLVIVVMIAVSKTSVKIQNVATRDRLTPHRYRLALKALRGLFRAFFFGYLLLALMTNHFSDAFAARVFSAAWIELCLEGLRTLMIPVWKARSPISY